jgi:hypothetical protein
MEMSGQLHVPAALTQQKNAANHLVGDYFGPKAVLGFWRRQKLLAYSGN